MATETRSNGTGTGLILGILVVILAIIAVAYFGGGFFRGNTGTNINVPESVDVNVNDRTGT